MEDSISIRAPLLSFKITECFEFVTYFIMSYNKTYENEHTLQMLNKVGKIRPPEGDCTLCLMGNMLYMCLNKQFKISFVFNIYIAVNFAN